MTPHAQHTTHHITQHPAHNTQLEELWPSQSGVRSTLLFSNVCKFIQKCLEKFRERRNCPAEAGSRNWHETWTKAKRNQMKDRATSRNKRHRSSEQKQSGSGSRKQERGEGENHEQDQEKEEQHQMTDLKSLVSQMTSDRFNINDKWQIRTRSWSRSESGSRKQEKKQKWGRERVWGTKGEPGTTSNDKF